MKVKETVKGSFVSPTAACKYSAFSKLNNGDEKWDVRRERQQLLREAKGANANLLSQLLTLIRERQGRW